jgi:hypothetical protein
MSTWVVWFRSEGTLEIHTEIFLQRRPVEGIFMHYLDPASSRQIIARVCAASSCQPFSQRMDVTCSVAQHPPNLDFWAHPDNFSVDDSENNPILYTLIYLDSYVPWNVCVHTSNSYSMYIYSRILTSMYSYYNWTCIYSYFVNTHTSHVNAAMYIYTPF